MSLNFFNTFTSFFQVGLIWFYFKYAVPLKNTHTTNKISIILGVIAHTVLWSIFFQQSLIYFLENSLEPILSKAYFSLPLAIIGAFLISAFFNRKNKPLHDFWNSKRKDTIEEIMNHLRSVRANIRTSRLSYAIVDIESLKQFFSLSEQFLTIKEARNVLLSIQHYSNLTKTPQEKDIIECQKALTEIILSFRFKEQINNIFKPPLNRQYQIL